VGVVKKGGRRPGKEKKRSQDPVGRSHPPAHAKQGWNFEKKEEEEKAFIVWGHHVRPESPTFLYWRWKGETSSALLDEQGGGRQKPPGEDVTSRDSRGP